MLQTKTVFTGWNYVSSFNPAYLVAVNDHLHLFLLIHCKNPVIHCKRLYNLFHSNIFKDAMRTHEGPFRTYFRPNHKGPGCACSKNKCLRAVQSHPDEGSLLAYSETLNHYKIENAGIKADKEKLQTPCSVRGISARRHIPSGKRSHTPPRLLLNITKG